MSRKHKNHAFRRWLCGPPPWVVAVVADEKTQRIADELIRSALRRGVKDSRSGKVEE